MPTEMELTLEQTQQGVSYEVSNIRVNSFTMKMEILLEPTSNKLMVVTHWFTLIVLSALRRSNANVLERFYTSAGNPVKEILLKLNLPDHRIRKDGGEAQVGNHINNQGNNGNQDDNVINDNNQGNVRTVNLNNGRGSCSNKKFMACNPKDYEGGGVIVYTHWIEKMESVPDMSGCGENQKVKYTAGSFIGKALTCETPSPIQRAGHDVYTDRFHELARLVSHLVTPENKRIERYIYGLAPQIHAMVAATEPTTIQRVVLKPGMLTDEAIKNRALKKITEKKRNNREPSRDGNIRDDNKRSRTGKAFATITNPIKKEYTRTIPKCPNCN
ncbi:hypothetical protein Tco_1403108 [Tanacetum coccineum]